MQDLVLIHHGVKGMKWGVRRYQNLDGSLTAAGKKRQNTSNVKRLLTSKKSFGSIGRAEEKRDMFQNKINKGGDRNIVTRNFVNDWRAGRAAQIDRKIANRRAKKAYAKDKTEKNRKRLNEARADRLLKNGLAPMVIGDFATAEGKYKRYRQTGKSASTAVLATAGTVLAINIVNRGAGHVAKTMIQEHIEKNF